MEGGGQLRLLLWRDFLIRKRKFVTLAGVLWATGIMIGIYTVRINIDNQDFPTCQFPARALPSAGLLPFLQSFMCSVNNECTEMDQFEEIPSYSKAKLTQMKGKLAPLFNETVLDIAATMPDAVKLLATVANVADDPTFIDFSRNGLKFKDLFNNPSRVKRYVTSHMDLDDDVAQSLMTSDISFQGILNGQLNRCSPDSIAQTLVVQNPDHLQVITAKLCALTKRGVQDMFMDLMYEINFSKYIKMLGDMYFKISGDDRISKLGDFVTALLRMTKLQNFLPPEALGIFYGKKSDFSYMNLDLIQKFLDQLEPTFGATKEYQSVREFADTAVTGVHYLHKMFINLSDNGDDGNTADGTDARPVDDGVNNINQVFNNVEVSAKETIDPFNVLAKLMNLITKFVPSKHDVLFYSTLLAKLMESALRVIDINMHIQDITYNVTLSNSEAINVLKRIPPAVVGKAFDALLDAERTQILTSKLNLPGQMFCDVKKLQDFLLISRTEAETVKSQLCSDAWKNYMTDLVKAFGVSEVRNDINEMASLLIQETLGKDTSHQLYSIEKDFQILRNFTRKLMSMDSEDKPGFDWKTLLGVTEDDELMQVVNEKAPLGKLMLISVHGALAKEIVKQNVILQYKLTPILLNTDTLVAALNAQLDATPQRASEGVRQGYADVVATVLMTATDEDKTYKALSTYSEDIFCNGGDNAALYLQFPTGVDVDRLAEALCKASIAIEGGLKNDSIVSKAIAKITNTTHTSVDEVNWTKLINNIQQLYVKLDKDYPYLFEFSTYAMDQVTQAKMKEMYEKAEKYWFGIQNLHRGLHLSVNLGFRLLNLLDHGLFNMTNESWLKMKFIFTKAIGPLAVIDDTVKLVTGLLTNSTHMSGLPPITVEEMSVVLPNLPQLIVDAVNIIIHDDTNIEPIISLMNASPPWPCSSSITPLLELTSSSKEAVLSLERLLCMDRDLQEEWMEYLLRRKVEMDKSLAWNNTQHDPHLFLNMSSTFNALLTDATLVKETFEYIVHEESSEDLGLMKAWNYAVDAANSTDGNEMIRRFLAKVDKVVDSIDTSVNTSVSLHALWEGYVHCINGSYIDGCRGEGRAVWKKALQVLSLIFESIVVDMTTYLTEVNAPDYNLLQLVGFTKGTALYMLYDKLPEFMGVLINSYFDYGFMSQVRRATATQFWDCDALVSALTPAPDSPIQLTDISLVKPYICPSFVYWLSLPRDNNVLFNVVAKPQYYFYSFPVKNATSSFESAFTKGVLLSDFMKNITKENNTSLMNELKIDSLKHKLGNFLNKILNYSLKETDDRYKVFSDINKKHLMSTVYLTRVVVIVNKLATAITNLTVDEEFITKESINQEDVGKLTSDLAIMKNVFKRRSVDAIAIHYDVLTDLLWRNDSSYTLIDAMDTVCSDLKQNQTKVILVDEARTKTQICAKNYRVLYGAVVNELVVDYEIARQSLLNFVKVLQTGDESDVTDVFDFLNSRIQQVNSIKHSIKFSYDLGLPIYLKYLESNLRGYKVLLTFLSGGDWWEELRILYNGPKAVKFLDILEQGFEVADSVLNNLDSIHLVRLIRDMKMNESNPCRNITLSDYIPDATGTLSELKELVCNMDKVELFGELPPLLFAAQGYESSLKLSKDVNYTALNIDISNIESNLGLIAEGPKEPLRPKWVTDYKQDLFRADVMNLLSKETLTKITFGVLSNGVDGGTLFLNNSECALCSQMTTWFKQLNLQLFKKQEYDNLLCHLHTMDMEDIYYTLKNDFHWGMFIRELISSRNYTNHELNKSMNEFLGLVEVHLLDDMQAPTTKLTECLALNVSRNEFGNATLFLQVLANAAKLLRAETPHLHQVEGVTDLPYLKQLYNEVANKLAVHKPLREYLKGGLNLEGVNDDEVVLDVMEADLNLLALLQAKDGAGDIEDLIRLRTNKWEHICEDHDCGDIFTAIKDNLNKSKIEIDLPTLQTSEYWQFSFVSSILNHIEGILSHTARLSGVASAMDVSGVMEGKLSAMLDVLARILMDENVDSILFSLEGLISELRPVLKRTALDADLQALASGLRTLHQFKTYLVEEADLRLKVSTYFPNPDGVESGLSALGINNTNFWSLAAPKIHAGYLQMKPVLSSKDRDLHISDFVCDIDAMSQILSPGEIDVVSAEEVSAATVEQFCALDEDIAKEMVMVLMGNADFTPVIDKVKEHLLNKLYSASDLTPDQGAELLERFPRMAAVLPTLQASLGGVMEDLGNEPLFEDLKDFSSVGNLISSSDFLANAGNMVCGAPFRTNVNRVLGNIIKLKDQAGGASQAQLDVLPTEFCRSMYKEIVNMDGGKIVWSFLKPLLMGKILYTPRTPRVQRIVEKANASFASMIQMTSLVHSFSSAFPSLEGISSHREGISALQQLVSGEGMAALRKQVLGDVELNIDVTGIFQKVGDLKGIGKLISKASDLLRCINLNRFVGSHNESTLMHEAARLSIVNEFSAGLVFMNEDKQESDFRNVEYKIRMDIDNAPTTARMHAYLWIPGPEASFVENMRYFRGFIQIQDMLDKAIIQLSAEASREERSREMMEGSRRKREVVEELDWAVYTQQEPYPCYRKDFFQTSLYESQALLVGMLFALLFTVTSAVRFIVADKESGNTMLMSVMGVNLNCHTLSWFITSFAELFLTEVCVVAVLWGGNILPRSDPTLLLAILLLYGLSVLSFCYLMSKLFSSASFASVCVGIAYLVTFMPFILILSLEAVMNTQLKLLVCLSMSSSLCYALLGVTRLEAAGGGARWAGAGTSPSEDGLSIAAAMAMVAFDGLLYLFLGWLIDRYYGIRTLRSNIITSATQDDKAGVSIVKVSKTYSAGGRRAKVALNNVSMELYKGQITTLLGHNGAGKTTLTNILTGMLRPSSGHVVLRGGGRVGVCPQHDVLVECLTPREHIALYAQLSTRDKEAAQQQVDTMVAALGLGAAAGAEARRLSGGTRRRVCVALAFVAAPALVSLDEPTAGVDPKARKDIWDMILKLKEDRTILLTTHHLDEAEILSDQIIIMHKGQVHTTGSPIDIKRSLGSGYKLTITLPDRRDEWGAEERAEERAKNVVATVREVVKNAYVADITSTLEMVLPFYDADGADNNFLQLCSSLEQQQETLGFSSYTMDCSTLEQVFCDICLKADAPQSQEYSVGNDVSQPSKSAPSKSGSSSSVRLESLVACEGPRRGSRRQQLLALLRARYLHLSRNRWLIFMLLVLPTLFVAIAMGFSMLRPPIENEINLPLTDRLYADSTQYLVPSPTVNSDVDPAFAKQVMALLQNNKQTKHWNVQDTPQCKSLVTRLECEVDANMTRPGMMVLPGVDTLNNWIVSTQDSYIEKRYGGFTSTLKNNKTNLIAWYNNKGYHAMPAFVNVLNNAILRAVAGTNRNITTYSHPLKISEEQLSRDTVFQRVADAGVCALVLVAFSAAAAGGAVPLVAARGRREKRLQLLAGVSPAAYWACALLWDMTIIAVNMALTAAVMKAFGFAVFVERNNLLAICILIMLFGYACGSLIHVAEKWFSSASVANMMLFCGNAFLGLTGLTVLLILDIISESDATDNARWYLHKIFMLSPQFALGDGMLEIAKNTIQAQVLYRFGMDTYKNPLSSDLIALHVCYLLVVGTALLLLNLAIEYGYFEALVNRWNYQRIAESVPVSEPEDVSAERKRVAASLAERHDRPLSLSTIGNINRGFVHTEGTKNSLQRSVATARDVAQCAGVSKYRARRPAVRDLTLGIAPGQCMALLGENGAGKSTTFSMLSGEIRPTRGKIYLDGKERDARGLCRGLISYCPQSDAIDPLLTVQETLQLYCRLRGIDEEDDVIERTIEMFDLTKYKTVRSGALSGGNKRKLCTAIAFMARTPLVLLDEPTSGMDPVSRGCVWRGVRAATAARRGVLLSTHALADARALAATVALLRRARLLALAPLQDCLHRFGGGYLVQCRGGGAAAAWRGARAVAPRASLRALHARTLHFHVPTHATVDGKEVVTKLSDIFRLMSELQATCDIEDFTVNQSSLEQMFLNFSDKTPIDDTVDIEPLPLSLRRDSEPLDTITSL